MNKMSKAQVLKKLHQAGFLDTKEDKFGNIIIKTQHGIDAYIQQVETGTWKPVVNIQWVNAYVLIPALAAALGLAAMDTQGFMAMVGCVFLGLGVGTMVLRPKQEMLKAALNKAELTNK